MELFQSKMKDDSNKFWIGLTEELNEIQWLWVDNTPLDVKTFITSFFVKKTTNLIQSLIVTLLFSDTG